MTVSFDTTSIRDVLREHLAEVLYLDIAEIDDHATFQDLGLDSVLGVELVSVINARYGLEELVEAVFENPTVHKLADHVGARAADRS